MTDNTPAATPSEAANKYKTLARALAANDAPACYEILALLKEQGKPLGEDEINALGMRWLLSKTGRTQEMAPFLKDIGFNFEQVVLLDQATENVGTRIPFRMFGADSDEALLFTLIDLGCISKDITDGMGDTLIVEALQRERFNAAQKLLDVGVDLNQTNLSGQSALHVFASRLNYQAVNWLCEHGADPTLEDLQQARPSEMVPENMSGWDTNCMFDSLEDYAENYPNGAFQPSPVYLEMMAREKSEDSEETYGEQAEDAKNLLTKLGL